MSADGEGCTASANKEDQQYMPDPEQEKLNKEGRKRHDEEIAMMNSRRQRIRPTKEELDQYALELHNAIHGVIAEPPGPGFSFGILMGIIQKGFDVAENLLKMGNLIKGGDKWKKHVEGFTSIFEWGKAIYGILDVFNGGGGDDSQKNEEFEKIEKQLTEISKRLEQIEEAIKQGFKDLIAHSDTAYFRENIMTPAQTLFDRMQRCQRAITETNTKDFLDDCAKYPPGNLLTAMYTFLEPIGNGLWTQLEANKFNYDTYKQWTDMMNHTAVQLSILDMFYYGIRLSHEKKSDSEKDRFQKGEEQEMVYQLDRIQKRLDKIEQDRVNKFTRGEAKTLLRSLSTKIIKEFDKPISKEMIDTLAKKLAEEWEKNNGTLVPFSLIVWRGKILKDNNFGGDNGFFRFAHYAKDGDDVVVVEHLYDDDKKEGKNDQWIQKYPRWDNLNLALIQPVTESMFNNQNKNNDMRETMDILRVLMSDIVFDSDLMAADTFTLKFLNGVFDDIKKLKKKPLLLLYNNQLPESPMYTHPSLVFETDGQHAVGGTENLKLIPAIFKFGKRCFMGQHIHMYIYIYFQE